MRLEIDLFVFGLGMGFTMMPVFTGAMQSIKGPAVARASTALNILQQAGASVGTAVLSVLLASALSSRLGGHGTIGSTAHVPASVRAHIAPPMAAAFGSTFGWALGMLVVAFVGSLALPRRRPVLTDDPSPARSRSEARGVQRAQGGRREGDPVI